MILDSLENAGLYESIHPRIKQAFDFLLSKDLQTLSTGKIELDGKNLLVNVVEVPGKTPAEARMETHNNYIDIQIPLNTTETMGWIAGKSLKTVTDAYNADMDVSFFADKATNFLAVNPLEFAIFFPTDGHQPGISEEPIKKIIVKVLV